MCSMIIHVFLYFNVYNLKFCICFRCQYLIKGSMSKVVNVVFKTVSQNKPIF